MSKFSYKTLFIIFFFLLIGVVILSRFVLPNKKVSAAWWDEMWHYRKAISIDNSSGSNQTNTQIKILDNYDLSALVTAGKIQSDLGDLRFTDINGNLINYWIEDVTNNSVDVWGLLSTIPSSGTTILMYYGNSSANSISNNSWMVDIGGTISSFNGYRIHAFTTNGTYYSYLDRNVEIIVVAGGGGGGYRHAAGGGAGGLIYRDSFSVTDNVSVTVGNGGSGATTGVNPQSGSNSIFSSLIAIGGGYAGGWDSPSKIGATGGSGGGSVDVVNSAGIPGQGNSGGNGYIYGSPYNWGGGGGAGEAGSNGTATTDGDGGDGLYYGDKFSVSYGENGWFAGGGGGGGHAPTVANQSIGGSGGGGNGGVPNVNSPGEDAQANTGGGGGGATTPGGGNQKGGNGGSGIVLVRYQSSVNTPTNIISNTPSSNEEVSIGPIAYWKFDEGVGTTAYDSTSNQNNGIISGATWQNEDQCISGKCLSFNSNIITSTNTPSLNFSGDFTISLWIKPNNNTSYQGVIAKMDNITTNGYRITLRNNGKIWCDLGNANSSSGSHNVNYSANVWQYITCQRSGSNMRVYVNGVLQEEVSANNNSINATSDLYIGRQASIEYLYGYLDEVKIYPYARTADQIKLDYNSRGSSKGSSANLGVKSNTAPDLKSKLVAYWKFDEGNGTIVHNGNIGNTMQGTLSGTTIPTWINNGKIGKAISFNGINSWIRSNNASASLNIPNDISISAWVNGSGLYVSNGTQYGTFIDKSGSTLRVRYWYMASSGWLNFTTSYGTVPAGQWSHIVVVNKPGNVEGWSVPKIYINGKEQVVTGSTQATNTGSAGYLFIGEYAGYRPYNPFNGLIDEVKIYNTTLTAEEIKQDYNQGSAVQMGSTNQTIGGTTTSLEYCIPGDTSYCASPVAEWKMDEGVGTSIIDTSGNNNTSTISGATWSQGKIGKSLNFNGTSDYVSIPTYDYATNSTISVWVKGNYSNGNQIIIGSPDSIALGLYNIGSTKALIGSANVSKSVGIANNFINDEWNHLSVVFDNSGNATYYCNGQLLSNSGTNNWTWSSGSYIGRRDSGSYFKGQIDHVRIYNYARTPAQIAYDYNKGGPVGWWKFDECQGNIAYDWSGIGNTGVINIGASGTQNSLGTCQVGTSAAWTNGATGKINSGLNFDGTDDYVNLGNLNTGNTNAITVSAWIYPESFSGYRNPVGKRNGSGTESWTFEFSGSSSGPLGFWIYSGGWRGGYKYTLPSINKWYNIIGTYDGSSIKTYVNGILVGNTNYTGTINTSTDNITIGSADGDLFFKGQIDDVRIYNYALTAEQIKVLYNGGAVKFN